MHAQQKSVLTNRSENVYTKMIYFYFKKILITESNKSKKCYIQRKEYKDDIRFLVKNNAIEKINRVYL